jgi:DNA-directed RNA polymerase subunit beta'
MFSRIRITSAGDTTLSVGDVVERTAFDEANALVGEEKAKGEDLVMGITEVALTRDSFLAAASFQLTNKVLIASSVRGAEDHLVGLKENVIIGRLIPAGTGFVGSKKYEGAKLIEQSIEENARQRDRS